MKCDICKTKIPPGQETCPSCGWNRQDKKHIQNPQVKMISKHRFVKLSVIILVIFVVWMSFLYIERRSPQNHGFISYRDMSLTEMIEKGYDDEFHTLVKAQEISNEAEHFLYEKGFTDVETSAYAFRQDDVLLVNVGVDGVKNKITYEVSYELTSGLEITDKSLTVYYDSKASMKEMGKLDQTEIEGLAQYLEIFHVYDLWNEGRTKMVITKGENIKEYHFNDDKISVYMSEEYDGINYHHYFFITQNQW